MMAAQSKKESPTWTSCPCDGGTLDRLIQPAILIILAEEPMHGYRLAERIGELAMFRSGKPDGSGVYRFLRSMERKGLVEATWDTSNSGPAKKSYEITTKGFRCLEHWVGTLERYRDGISSLLRAARKVFDP